MAGTQPRGRVVMLVDNLVVGDSRVQKEARAAAEHGWDVVLLGRSKDAVVSTWRIGAAEVRQIPIPSPMWQRRHEFRSGLLRSPLAYPAGRLQAYRDQQVRAWRADLQMRRHTDELEGDAWIRRVRRLPSSVGLRVFRGWVGMRSRRTHELALRRRQMTSPVDRATTGFWQLTMGRRAWRRLDPGMWDWELAYAPEIDRLMPDIIHANDFRMLGIGARAKMRARSYGRDVRLVWDAHEFLPGIKTWDPHPRWHLAQMSYEKEFAPYADAVVTVSPALADLLQVEHQLPTKPQVILNAPYRSDSTATAQSIREVCKLAADVPLLVYSGGIAPQRGVATMIEAMPALADAHVALVVPDVNGAELWPLAARAKELGVADRLHVLPYVPYDQVAAFLRTADIGVIPIHHWPNHEIALITKFFEYAHARLPIVVSDVRTMAETTRERRMGEVFAAEDVEDYIRAVRAVLANLDAFRAAYDDRIVDEWTWERQAEILDEVYTKLHP